MKLKCGHARRVMVLPTGTTVHRDNGSKCLSVLIMANRPVTKIFSKGVFIDIAVTGSR